MLTSFLAVCIIALIITILLLERKSAKDFQETNERFRERIKSIENLHNKRLKEMKESSEKKIIMPLEVSTCEDFFRLVDKASHGEHTAYNTFKVWQTLEELFPIIKDDGYYWKVSLSPITRPALVGEKIKKWERESRE